MLSDQSYANPHQSLLFSYVVLPCWNVSGNTTFTVADLGFDRIGIGAKRVPSTGQHFISHKRVFYLGPWESIPGNFFTFWSPETAFIALSNRQVYGNSLLWMRSTCSEAGDVHLLSKKRSSPVEQGGLHLGLSWNRPTLRYSVCHEEFVWLTLRSL